MKAILLLMNIGLCVLAFAWPFALLSSLFMFDAPGSEENPLNFVLLGSLFLYPLTIMHGTGLFFKKRSEEPLEQLVKYTMTSAIGPLAIVVSIVLLDIFCSGRFACN